MVGQANAKHQQQARLFNKQTQAKSETNPTHAA
jgi:hypothetical protein